VEWLVRVFLSNLLSFILEQTQIELNCRKGGKIDDDDDDDVVDGWVICYKTESEKEGEALTAKRVNFKLLFFHVGETYNNGHEKRKWNIMKLIDRDNGAITLIRVFSLFFSFFSLNSISVYSKIN
jgi:hypothetical protein